MLERVKTQIVSANELSTPNRKSLKDWFQQQFGHIEIVWAEPEWYGLAWHEENIIGCLSIVERHILVGCKQIYVGGIGGVMTRQTYRCQGVATKLLGGAANFLQTALHVDFGLLLCRKNVVPVYQKSGWICVDASTHFVQPSGTQTYTHATMILPCSSHKWLSGTVNLCGFPW